MISNLKALPLIPSTSNTDKDDGSFNKEDQNDIIQDDYSCGHCKSNFDSIDGLKGHLQNTHKEKKAGIACEMCGKILKSKLYLNLHVKRIHDKIKDNKCNFREEYFVTKSEVRRHENYYHTKSIICELCNKSFAIQKTLRDHIQNIHVHRCEK